MFSIEFSILLSLKKTYIIYILYIAIGNNDVLMFVFCFFSIAIYIVEEPLERNS